MVNKVELVTYLINDENMKNYTHTDIKIGNGKVMGVIGTGFEISLVTRPICEFTDARIADFKELKLQSTVLVTAIGSRSWRIKKQVYIPLYNDNCFEHVFLVPGQLLESLLIGADFL